MNEKRPPPPPGKPAEEEMENAKFLREAQHWRSVAEAVYVPEAASFSLLSNVPESAIVAAEWEPDSNSARPAYAICVDAVYGAVVLAVRGTSHPLDMLLDCGTQPEKFEGGFAHGGYVHATEVLCEEVEQHIDKALEVHGQEHGKLKLVVVGHSMGASVGIMSAIKLRSKYKDVECWGYAPSACLSLDLARECASFATCFVGAYDLVPRFSVASVEELRQQVYDFDWDEAEKVAKGDDEWKNIRKSLEAMKNFQRAQRDMGEKAQQARHSVSSTMEDTRKNLRQIGPGQDGDGGNHRRNSKETNESNQEGEKKEPPCLYPPGKLYVLACDPPGCGKKPEQRSDVPEMRNYGAYPTFDESREGTWVLHKADQEDFSTIVVSPWCISDHMLGSLQDGIYQLQRQCHPDVPKSAS